MNKSVCVVMSIWFVGLAFLVGCAIPDEQAPILTRGTWGEEPAITFNSPKYGIKASFRLKDLKALQFIAYRLSDSDLSSIKTVAEALSIFSDNRTEYYSFKDNLIRIDPPDQSGVRKITIEREGER